ncbi:MAG: sigma-70 family RNA polymerase sigma factor [Lachnospiraceae bacterium]|nr:sigma-70 family RNA polymerase sigma factor [Lachnospiraceae bacterium]
MTNTLNRKNEEFKNECKLINLKYEYGKEYTGKEEWAVITELSEKELFEKYPEQLREYLPFILLSIEQGKAITEFNQNEDKFRKRSKNNGDAYGYDDDLTERFHPEAIEPDFIEKQELDEYEFNHYQKKMKLIEMAVASLTEKQHKYLVARFVDGKSAREIAKEEGVSHQVIDRHLIAAIKKFEKVFEGFFRK